MFKFLLFAFFSLNPNLFAAEPSAVELFLSGWEFNPRWAEVDQKALSQTVLSFPMVDENFCVKNASKGSINLANKFAAVASPSEGQKNVLSLLCCLTEHKQLLLDCMNDNVSGNVCFDREISAPASPYQSAAAFIIKVIRSIFDSQALRKYGVVDGLAYKIYFHLELFGHLCDMMKDNTLKLGVEHSKKHMMALRKCDSFTAKICFAERLKIGSFDESWSGGERYDVNDPESMKLRSLETMRLYREAAKGGVRCAYNNFGAYLLEHKFNESFQGDKRYDPDSVEDERMRLLEVADLARKSESQQGHFNYVMILRNKDIHQSWDGKKTYSADDDARFDECRVFIQNAYKKIEKGICPTQLRLAHLLLVLENGVRHKIGGKQLKTHKDACSYVMDELNSFSLTTYQDLVVKLKLKAYIKYIGFLEDEQQEKTHFEKGHDLLLESIKSGLLDEEDEEIQKFKDFFMRQEEQADGTEDLSADLSSIANAVSGDIEELPPVKTEEQLAREAKKRRQKQSLELRVDQVEREFLQYSTDRDEQQRNYERLKKARELAWLEKQRALTDGRGRDVVQLSNSDMREIIIGSQLRNFTNYRVVDINGNDFVTENEKIKELIEDVQKNGKRGQVHALQGKRKGDPTLITRKIEYQGSEGPSACRLVYFYYHKLKQIVVVHSGAHY